MTKLSEADYAAARWSKPWLFERAARSPDRVALESHGKCVSYGKLARRVDAVVSSLSRCGVERGDVVAVSLPNGLPIVELIHAGFAGDFVALLINRRLSAPEVEFQLRDSGARYFIHQDGDEVSRQVELEASVTRIELAAREDGFVAVEIPDVARRSQERVTTRATLDLSQPRFILYTSGTSGEPKGVALSGSNLLASAKGSAMSLGASATDRWLLCMPVFHVGGLSILLRSTLAGSEVVLHSQFSPEAVSHDLDTKAVTGVSLVANMLKRILDLRSDVPPPPALSCVLLGGGPAPAPLVEAAVAAGFPVAPTYGLTEAASQVATRPPNASLSAGLRPIEGTRLEIVGDDGNALAADRPGEICVSGGSVMAGYWNSPEATRRALRDGWLHTGDIGSLDRDGLLTVHDRRSDLILSGGENVYPAEIESVLLEHPAVAEAGVTGEPDETFGARPVAWLVASEVGEVDSSVLNAHCRSKLAGYKCPVKFAWLASLPRTANGKLLRRELGGRGNEAGE